MAAGRLPSAPKAELVCCLAWLKSGHQEEDVRVYQHTCDSIGIFSVIQLGLELPIRVNL